MGDGSGIGAVGLQGVSEAFKVVLGEGWHRKTGKNGGAGNAGKEGGCKTVPWRNRVRKNLS
jgi:hypothetical protein